MKYLCIKPFGYYKVGFVYDNEDFVIDSGIPADAGIEYPDDNPETATAEIYQEEINIYFKPLPEVEQV